MNIDRRHEIPIPAASIDRTETFLLNLFGSIFFALLTVLSAQIRIPLPFTPIPMTLQTFVVPLAGGFLGLRWGIASMLMYLSFGLLDVNAFATASRGMPFVFAPSAGYLVGFVVAAAIMGWSRDHKFGNGALFTALVVANLMIFVCGMIGLMINVSMSALEAWYRGVAPFLPGGAIKLAASYLVLTSYRVMRRQ
ncbi:biotin transporter BioY [bacterium]|nr:biotin transporter BioY [bacterium]